MELTIGVSVGSSIQIAAGMIPLLVIIAWGMDKDLTLFFVSAREGGEGTRFDVEWCPQTSVVHGKRS